MELEMMIEQATERAASKIIKKLRRENMIRTSEWNAYKRTERLLKLYPKCSDNSEMAHALESIKDDVYYPIITRHYFQSESFEFIADSMDIHIRTVFQNRKRLVTQLSEYLFADEISKTLLDKRTF